MAVLEGKIEKIDDYRWKIPRSYKSGMRVDGLVYATEKMLAQIKQDKALEQVANVASLPGIVKYSLAMPDIHWGYGFCLTEDAQILSKLGYYRKIKEYENDWQSKFLKCMDFDSLKPINTSILKFLKLKSSQIYKITTKTGYEIKATSDHPFFTPSGMKQVKKLKEKDKVAIYPFQGVPYEKPLQEVIISEKDLRKVLLKHGRKPSSYKHEIIIKKLKMRNLLPLTYDHPKLGYILKIMGFVFGDGSMNFIGKRGDGVLHFSGKPDDLEEVRKDIKKIGYTPGPVHHFKRKNSQGSNKYYDCYSFHVNASSLVVLLETLGVPRGSKVNQGYRIPNWIFRASLWQKRLFLASLFGCELRIPHRRLKRRGYFNAPSFSMSKREELIENGKVFLDDIAKLLKDFGVRTLYIDKRKKHINKKGKISWALELIISPTPENLYNLWGRIGFEYNLERAFMANVAVYYLKYKLNILKEKQEIIEKNVPELLKLGWSYQRIAKKLATGNSITKRFVTDVCWKLNKGRKITPRVPFSFPKFEDYLKNATSKLGRSGMIWDKIDKIKEINYEGYVYDFTVSHPDHNFIANNFVVSNCIGGVAATDPSKNGVISPGGVGYDVNCGMRLIRTDLTYEDVKSRIKDIVYALYTTVPAGVGSRGKIKVSQREEKQLMLKGAKWAVERSYGIREDLEHCEERGQMEGADPDNVSERAFERGKAQTGTLGSGNHFLEIQVVDEIYNSEIADKLGIYLGSITIMIHTGSRGFGYQICDDYLKVMMKAVQKYGINLPDRQLACAPINSSEAQDYISAMKCAANYAWCNRQCITHLVRKACEKIFNKSWESLGLNLIYDVAHNIAKFEKHNIDGKEKIICVHRKGATRAYPAGHEDLPDDYKKIGQPVIIPGDMGTNSYLLIGTDRAMEETFGSTCHGAGRVMSRSQAIRRGKGRSIVQELEKKGVVIMSKGYKTLLEEMPEAYKDVNDVVDTVVGAGISNKICRMRPLGVVKG